LTEVVLLQFRAPVLGSKARVRVYADRIEWNYLTHLWRSDLVEAGFTRGASMMMNDANDVAPRGGGVPFNRTTKVETLRAGGRKVEVSVTARGETVVFRVRPAVATRLTESLPSRLTASATQ
jgi:hypothetical protein